MLNFDSKNEVSRITLILYSIYVSQDFRFIFFIENENEAMI